MISDIFIQKKIILGLRVIFLHVCEYANHVNFVKIDK